MGIILAIFAFIAFPILLLFVRFSYLIIKCYYGKSPRDPGYAPVYGTVYHKLLYFSRLYDYHAQVARKTPTFRFLAPAASQIYTTDVRNIEHVLQVKFDKYSKGGYNQLVMKDIFGHGIFNVDGEKWRHQRKLANLEFSTRDLQVFSSGVFKRLTVKVVNAVSEFAIAGGIFDMQDMMMKFTLDSIIKVAFGVDLNCLDGSSKEGTKFMKAFDVSNALVYGRYKDPFWQLKKLLNIGSEASINNNLKVIDGFVNKFIHDKRNFLALQQDYNERKDLLSRFLVASEEDPETMNDKYLRDIILNFICASKDPSATTLSWFFYMLCKNPLVQEKIVQEVGDITGSKENGTADLDDFVANITEETLERMQYLHAALTETMRLYPAVPLDGKCAEIDDVLPDGYRVKKGDGVNYAAYAMARMPYIWGDDAEEFRPERWLLNGIFQPQSPFKFVSFHGGPRICLGKDLAYRQMKIASMALLHFFRFKLAEETKNVTYKTMFTLHIDGGLHLRAIPRKS